MCFILAFIIEKHRIFHTFDANSVPFYSYSCLTPYLCVICRIEDNKTKIKQFGQELKELCKRCHGRDHNSKHEENYVVKVQFSRNNRFMSSTMQCGRDHKHVMVATTNLYYNNCDSEFAMWSRPQELHGHDHNILKQPMCFTSYSMVATTMHL